MAARSTLADIIADLRMLIDDPTGTNQMFTDDQLQDILDNNGADARYEDLTPVQTYSSGGYVSWFLYISRHFFWETDATLSDGMYNPVTSGSANYTQGRWTFATSRLPPVLVTGRWYDQYGAAADCWDIKAAKFAAGFDFHADGGRFFLDQKFQHAKERAQYFRSFSVGGASFTTLTRDDVNYPGAGNVRGW